MCWLSSFPLAFKNTTDIEIFVFSLLECQQHSRWGVDIHRSPKYNLASFATWDFPVSETSCLLPPLITLPFVRRFSWLFFFSFPFIPSCLHSTFLFSLPAPLYLLQVLKTSIESQRWISPLPTKQFYGFSIGVVSIPGSVRGNLKQRWTTPKRRVS